MSNGHRHVMPLALLGATLLAGGAGYHIGTRSQPAAGPSTRTDAAPADARPVLYWYDPMYPQQRFDRPGKSPFMDMALVPRYADTAAGGAGGNSSISIDPARAQQLGMREAYVRRAALPNVVNATGTIEFDPRGVVELQARAAGIVEHAPALAVGDVITRAQPLFELRIPAWRAAADEWLTLARSGDATLLPVATQRLQMLGMSREHIATLARTRQARSNYTIASPIDGVVVSLPTRAGMAVADGQTLIRLNSTRRVVLLVAVPEALGSPIREGDRVRVHMNADPTTKVTGTVDAILPTMDPATRTTQLRVWLPNPRQTLRPGATARVEIESSRTGLVLGVPTEAVIRIGRRTLVMLSEGDGRYRPVEVETGIESGGYTEVVRGLQDGQRIVASGQFLLDSEASVLGVLPTPLPPAPGAPGTPATTNVAPAPAGAPSASRAAPPPADPPRVHEAEARVVTLVPGRITLAHGAFSTLGMPGMTMTFPVADADLARGLAAGDRVRVGVVESDAGLTVVRIVPLATTP